MAATAEGIFIIIDRASRPMQRMQKQAAMTDNAIENLGERLDKVGTTQQQQNISKTERELETLGKTSTQTSKSSDMLERSFRKTDRSAGSFKKTLVELGAVLGSLRMIVRVAALPTMILSLGTAIGVVVQAIGALAGGIVALIPRIVDLVGVIGALPATLAGLVGAMAVIKLAFKDFGEAMAGNAEALKRLTPEARSFLETLKQYEPVMARLRRTAQEGLFPGLESAVRRLARAEPVVTRLVALFSGTLGGAANRASRRFTTRGFLGDFEVLGRQGAAILDRGAKAIENIVAALVDVGVAARPFTEWLTRTITAWTDFWAESAKAGRESGRLAMFFDRARSSLELFGSILKNLWETFTAIGRAARPLGDELWQAFDRATERWADMNQGLERQLELTRQFNALKPALFAIVGLVADLGNAIWRMGREQALPGIVEGLREFVDHLERALNVLVKEFGPPLIALLEQLVILFENLAAANSPIVIFVQLLTEMVDKFNWLVENIPGLQGMLTAAFSVYVIAKFSSALTGVITKMGALLALEGAAGLGGAAGARGAGRAITRTGRVGPFLSTAAGGAAAGGGIGLARRFLGAVGPKIAIPAAIASFFMQTGNTGGTPLSIDEVTGGLRERFPVGRGIAGLEQGIAGLRGAVPSAVMAAGGGGGWTEEYVAAIKMEIEAREDLLRTLKDERAFREQAKAPGMAQDVVKAFRTRMAGGGGFEAARTGLTTDVSAMLGQIQDPKAKRIFSQNLLNMVAEAEKRNKNLRGIWAATSSVIATSWRQFGSHIAIINGKIYKDVGSAWKRIQRAMTNPANQALAETTAAFTGIQQAAISALTMMGFSTSQAQNIVLAQERGGSASAGRLQQIYSGDAPSEVYGTFGGVERGKKKARGGRLPGRGLHDTIPVPGGLAAPGELVVNRHTEARIDRLLSMYGTSLSREVERETVRHDQHGPGGHAGTHNYALGGVGGGLVSGDTDFVPAMMSALTNMARATGRSIYVQSGRRTLGEQAALVASKGLYSASNPTGAAAPSPSAPHVQGIAADITPGREVFGGVAGRYGVGFPLPAEPWHAQLGSGVAGGAAGAIMSMLMDPLKAPRTKFGAVPGALSQRAMDAMAAGMTKAVNRVLSSGQVFPMGGAQQQLKNALGGRAGMPLGAGGPARINVHGGSRTMNFHFGDINVRGGAGSVGQQVRAEVEGAMREFANELSGVSD